jgi:hypothetical protein
MKSAFQTAGRRDILSTSRSPDASSQQKSAGYHKRQAYDDEERRFDPCQFPIATHGAPQLLTTPAQDVFEYLAKG